MNRLEDLSLDIYNQIAELKAEGKNKKCLNCECYHGLLYYLKKELNNTKDPDRRKTIESLVSTLDIRKELKVHGCLGCEPCPPAEWSTELIKSMAQSKECSRGGGKCR